jgi:hypothetical protein
LLDITIAVEFQARHHFQTAAIRRSAACQLRNVTDHSQSNGVDNRGFAVKLGPTIATEGARS